MVVLVPPVVPMLAQAAESMPGPATLRGGLAFEQKFDGHRAILFTPSRPGGPVLLQTRRGALIQDRFPDLIAAADQLPAGLVLDGELLVWDTVAERLSFEGLQRRAASRRTAADLAVSLPAFFVVFDVLQQDGREVMDLPYPERRRRIETLFAARGLTALWTLCPMTTDPGKAREWLETWTDVSGVEGLVVKGMETRYLPGFRGWTKVHRRDSTEAVVGAVTGTLTRPQVLILGRLDADGRLHPVGRTVPLRPEQPRQVSEHLVAAEAGTRRKGCGSPRRGAAVTSSTRCWCGPSRSRR
ncbi:ATP-dependent DNA ligase [Streptomyces sp. NPDC097619]|uniref:ATP-dependent DNA ligase n=1 Tax=Streptomyces sp. NPDC097619 TaxID=3157228 RepID=UPI003330287F